MLNIVSFLIITLITLTRMKSGYASNPLLDAGTLVLTGYILSLLMVQVRLHHYYGFIFAGILLGGNGLGFIQEHFAEYIFLFRNRFHHVCRIESRTRNVHKQSGRKFLAQFSGGSCCCHRHFFRCNSGDASIRFSNTVENHIRAPCITFPAAGRVQLRDLMTHPEFLY